MLQSSFFTEYFTNYEGKELLKPAFYFDIYDRYANALRGTAPTFLEIGVFKGGSLDMWKAYLGEGSAIYGVDVNPATKEFEEYGHTIIIGDQSNYAFLKELKQRVPPPNFILDDGGHFPVQQIRSFLKLFPHLVDGGIYLVEDVHTSYYPSYGGGYGVYYTFQNFAFQLVHLINLINIHSQRGCHSSTQLTSNLIQIFGITVEEGQYLLENLYTIHFYDSIVVFEKQMGCRSLNNNQIAQQHIVGEK